MFAGNQTQVAEVLQTIIQEDLFWIDKVVKVEEISRMDLDKNKNRTLQSEQ